MYRFEPVAQQEETKAGNRASMHSSADDSLDKDETLPLYEPRATAPHDSDDVDDLLPLPPSTAGPHIIRGYIIDLLIAQGGLDVEQAQSIAAKWTLGSGVELRKYSPEMFREVFGAEGGWVLYRLVRMRVLTDERKAEKPPNPRRRKAAAAILFFIGVCLISGIIYALNHEADWAIVIAFFGGFPWLILVICGLIYVYQKKEPVEEVVSSELQRVYGSPGGPLKANANAQAAASSAGPGGVRR